MLYKNDAPYKLAETDVLTLKKKFRRFPLTVIYPPERVMKSRSPKNRLPDKPNSIAFPLVSVVKTSTGTDQWRYAENVIIKEHGVKKYTPKNFRFNGRFQLEEKDIELAWFLFTKSPYCKGGTNEGRFTKFMFEDLAAEADIKAEKEALRSQVKALIYGGEMGLGEERLRKLAKALFIKNIDILTYNQVKIAVEHEINRNEHGYQRFVEMTDMDELINVRSKIQNLVDLKMIKYDTVKKQWEWTGVNGKPEIICKVPPTMNPNDVIYDYYVGNKDFQNSVESVEKSKKRKVKEEVIEE